MADKTFGVKVSEELHDRAKLIIESSGLTAKDWFQKAIALYEMNSIKQGSSDYTQDLTELEHHTTRMYELIVNMIQRSVYLKDHAVKEVADKLEKKELLIEELERQNKDFKDILAQSYDDKVLLEQQVKELEGRLAENQTTFDNNQALISEYKEKNDVLNGLVAQYKAYGDENEKLKRQLTEVESTLTIRATDAEQKAEALTKLVEQKNEEIDSLTKQSEETLQMAIEKKDLEREKAVMGIERQYQAEIAELNAAHAELNASHNDKVRALYDEIAELRKVNEENREKYLAEVEGLRKRLDEKKD